MPGGRTRTRCVLVLVGRIAEFQHEAIGVAAQSFREHTLGMVVGRIRQNVTAGFDDETGGFGGLDGAGFLDAVQGCIVRAFGTDVA